MPPITHRCQLGVLVHAEPADQGVGRVLTGYTRAEEGKQQRWLLIAGLRKRSQRSYLAGLPDDG